MTDHDPHRPEHDLPAELAAADGALRSLAALDLAAAPEGLEDRLGLAGRPALRAAAGEREIAAAPRVIARIGVWAPAARFAGARPAAGLSQLGDGAAAWVAVRFAGGSAALGPPSLETRLDACAWMSIAFDNPFGEVPEGAEGAGPASVLDPGAWNVGFSALSLRDPVADVATHGRRSGTIRRSRDAAPNTGWIAGSPERTRKGTTS